MLLAHDHRATVKVNDKMLLPGDGASAVGLASAMAQTAVENDRTEIGLDVLNNFISEKV